VSVVIPTYNRASLLQRALDGVAVQDYRPIEVIVVDDGSVDETRAVLLDSRAALERVGIRVRGRVLERNSGAGAARNEGLRLARGAYIAFLDSDDVWREGFVSSLVTLLEKSPDSAVAFSGHVGIDVDGNAFATVTPDLENDVRTGRLPKPYERFLRSFPFITAGTLVRRTALDAVGWFDETLASWQDADLWFRLAKQFDFVYTSRPLACYRVHAGNRTNERLDWYLHQLRVRIRHFDDIRDPSSRELALKQIQRTQVLLQEQLLREDHGAETLEPLLANELAPSSIRYRIGRLAMRAPTWLRRSYAAAIRTAGDVRRSLVFAFPAVRASRLRLILMTLLKMMQ